MAFSQSPPRGKDLSTKSFGHFGKQKGELKMFGDPCAEITSMTNIDLQATLDLIASGLNNLGTWVIFANFGIALVVFWSLRE